MHFITAFTFFTLYINFSREDFEAEMFKLRFAGNRMSSGIVKLIPEVSFIKCAIFCAQNPDQVAFNYNAADRNCEIITKQDTPTSIQADDNYNYYVLSSFNPCKDNLCAEGMLCFATSDGVNYDCRSVVFVLPGEENQNNVDPCDSSPCLESSACSVNSDGDYYCLDATSTDSGTRDDKIQSENNPCDPNPCLKESVCSATADGMDYQCLNCIYPSGIGKNCEEYVCDGNDHCFNTEDTLYVVSFEESSKPQVSWEDTFAKCSKAKLEMVTIKNDSIVKTLMSELTSICGFMNIATYKFWIGLKRKDSDAEWKWTDGSSLEEYQPWEDNEPGKEELYVSFAITPNTDIKWAGEVNAPYEDIWHSVYKYPAFCQAKISTGPKSI